MGGLPCAKTIIDQRNAVVQAMDCMATSILLAAPSGAYPSEEMEDKFVAAAQKLAQIAAEIEKHVREGGEYDDHEGGGGDDGGGSSPRERQPLTEGL